MKSARFPCRKPGRSGCSRTAAAAGPHPIHVHFEEFRILSHNGIVPKPGVPINGFIEYGRLDVAPLQISEEISVFIRFQDMSGRYAMHCHNVVHEDHAMMVRFDIAEPPR